MIYTAVFRESGARGRYEPRDQSSDRHGSLAGITVLQILAFFIRDRKRITAVIVVL